jgi:hypothetical protein
VVLVAPRIIAAASPGVHGHSPRLFMARDVRTQRAQLKPDAQARRSLDDFLACASGFCLAVNNPGESNAARRGTRIRRKIVGLVDRASRGACRGSARFCCDAKSSIQAHRTWPRSADFTRNGTKEENAGLLENRRASCAIFGRRHARNP